MKEKQKKSYSDDLYSPESLSDFEKEYLKSKELKKRRKRSLLSYIVLSGILIFFLWNRSGIADSFIGKAYHYFTQSESPTALHETPNQQLDLKVLPPPLPNITPPLPPKTTQKPTFDEDFNFDFDIESLINEQLMNNIQWDGVVKSLNDAKLKEQINNTVKNAISKALVSGEHQLPVGKLNDASINEQLKVYQEAIKAYKEALKALQDPTVRKLLEQKNEAKNPSKKEQN